jgi:hypothetical protein
MTRLEYRLMHVANLLVGGTGLVYGVLKLFFGREGEYGMEMHPAQPDWQHAHVLAAPLLVICIGLFWKNHIQLHWQRGLKEGRRSGLLPVTSYKWRNRPLGARPGCGFTWA